MDGEEGKGKCTLVGRGFQAQGVGRAKALRHGHAQAVGEVLEQAVGRVGADTAELIGCGQGLMAVEWTLGPILSCQEANDDI